MSKSSAQFPFSLPEGFGSMAGNARESFEAMSRSYSEWLHNANRVQAEMIRFVNERFSKDMSLISRFAACRQPDELLRLQAEVVSELASDYMQEGARIFSLFSDTTKGAIESFGKAAAGSKRPG